MRKAYASMGLDWHPQEVITIHSPDGREIAGNAADGLYERLLAQGVTGVYCISWRVLMALYRQAHERGHAIGKYLTIVGSGGHDMDDLVHPQPARVYWHFTYADAVIRSLRLLQEGTPLPRRIRIPVYLRKFAGHLSHPSGGPQCLVILLSSAGNSPISNIGIPTGPTSGDVRLVQLFISRAYR